MSVSLPASLSLLPNLKVLLLEGNPLRGIRRDLLTVGYTLKRQTQLMEDNKDGFPICTNREI